VRRDVPLKSRLIPKKRSRTQAESDEENPATMRKTAKIIVITAILDATQTNRAKPAAMRISAKSEGSMCDLLAEERHEQGDCSDELCNHRREEQRGTDRQETLQRGEGCLRPLSQPRPMERVSRVVARETLLVIEWDLQAIRERKAEQFFFGLSTRADQP
jgi:hypothetical protein